MLSHVQIVNRVVDTLDLRLSRNRQPSSWLLSHVPRWRSVMADWQPGQDPELVEIPEVGTFILRGSSRPFEFVLVHPEICDIRIWKPERWDAAVGGATGQIMFNFRSKFLQLVGLEAARLVVARVEACMIAATGPKVYLERMPARPDFLRVARGDLAVDLAQDRNLKWSDLTHMVCQTRNTDPFTTLTDLSRKRLLESVLGGEKEVTPPMDNKGVSFPMPEPGPCERAAARVLDAFSEAVTQEIEDGPRGARVTRSVMSGRTPQTVYFGRFTSPLHAKVYNKLGSLKPQRKLYMLDVWTANEWDGLSKVWRWEWTFTGDFLKSVYIGDDRVDVREFDDFLAYIPALWFYVTRKWLRQVVEDPTEDRHVDRMHITPYWAVLQSAWDADVGVERDNSRYLRIKSERDADRKMLELKKQALGCITSAMAIRARRDALTVVADLLPVEFDPETGEVLRPGVERTSMRSVAFAELAEMVSDEDQYDLDVFHRQRMIGLDDISDSALTSLQRAERMAEGMGS